MTYQLLKSEFVPRIVLINLSRQNEGHFSYAAVEAIKDGLIFSGKYEGGTKLIPHPHIVIFSNWYPARENLTEDRWDIRTLRNNPPRTTDW